jgi:LuxR family maltose regulon positive regulatory protein
VAVSTGLTGGEVEIRALQALVHQGRGDQSGALAALTQALKRGEREGYIETFVDLGTPMVELLRAAASRGMGSDYLNKLLALMDAPGTGTGSHAPALVEALSERELEVLRLVAQGRSNQQIAKDLVVATGTVKKHISNIFAKLNVESRTQAVARARELDLL